MLETVQKPSEPLNVSLPVDVDEEIDKAVAQAVRNGEILDIKRCAVAIAATCGAEARSIAERLIGAGIRAGVPMEISTPD